MKINSVRLVRLLSKVLLVLGILFLAIVGYGYIRVRPLDVKFTDVTSSSFTVSWVTNSDSVGNAMVVGPNFVLPITVRGIGENISYDSRDVKIAQLEAVEKTQESISENTSLGVKFSNFVTDLGVVKSNKYYVHHVTVSNLEPETEYKVMVGDGLIFVNTRFSNESNSIKTFGVPNEIAAPVPAYGSVKDAKNQDIPIDELQAVTDGVVYFNYLDEATGNKSEIYTSALNSEGNWYIDMSNAKASDGQGFLQKYGTTVTNILAEVTLEAGPLGTWKKTINIQESTPVEMIVLNVLNSSQNQSNPESLIRLDAKSVLLKETVQSVNAMEAGCYFISYCGCGKSVGGKWVDCDCDESTLEARNCNSQVSAQEAVDQLGSNVCNAGQSAVYANTCKVCNTTERSYNFWKDAPGGMADCPNQTGAVYTPPVNTDGCSGKAEDDDCTYENGTKVGKCIFDEADRLYCGNPTDVDDDSGKDQDPDSMDMRNRTTDQQCTDPDGCSCEYEDSSRNHTVFPPDYCRVNASGTAGSQVCDSDEQVYSSSAGRCVTPGESCGTNKKYNDNGECVAVSNPPDPSILACWNNTWGPLYRGMFEERERCDNGTWVADPTNSDESPCAVGNGCSPKFGFAGRCVDYYEKILYCNFWSRTYQAVEEEGSDRRAAIEIVVTNAGSKCTTESGCVCKGGEYNNELISNNEFCPDTSFCAANDVGKVCSFDGKVCSDTFNSSISEYECESPVQSMHLPNLVKGVSAEDIATGHEYILDPLTGMIGGITSGVYIFDHNGKTYAFTVEEKDLEVNDGKILIYLDTNENGKYDEGTDTKISDLASEISITTLKQQYKYSLMQGFNFVSLPFLVSNPDTRTAASLLKTLNEVYNNEIFSIAKFSGSWKVVGQNAVLYDNNDFQLIPGEGYVIKANRDIDISIIGQPVQFENEEDHAPILFNMGWNLIGIYGTNAKSYTAESLLDSINGFEETDFTADNVTKWDTSIQKYEGLQKTVENGVPMVYGFDYPIEFLKGYFVKVTQGSGNWEPEIGQ